MTTHIDNEFISCKICLDSYDNNLHSPLSIYPCGHTYCLACLEQLENQTCPECRANIEFKVHNWELLRIINQRISNDNDENDNEAQPLLVNNRVSSACSACSRCTSSLKIKVNSLYVNISNQTPRNKLLLVYFIFILSPILLVYPLTLIYVGITDEFACSIDQRIPAWAIVYGCGGTSMAVIYVCLKIYLIIKSSSSSSSSSSNDSVKKVAYICLFLLALFEFVWFFVGCVWVFAAHARVNFVDPSSMYYCQPAVFKCAFGTLIFQCIVFGLVVIFSTCCILKK
jgi:hypothetical protein